MATDVYPDSDEEDILHYMTCSICGSEYEIIQHTNNNNNPMQEELKLRKQMLKTT